MMMEEIDSSCCQCAEVSNKCGACTVRTDPEAARMAREEQAKREAELAAQRAKEEQAKRDAERARVKEKKRKAEEETRRRQEKQRRADADANVASAEDNACKTLGSLSALGQAYQHVKSQRVGGSGLQEPVKAFRDLVAVLKESIDHSCVAHVSARTESLRTTAREAEQTANRQRQDLSARQAEIRQCVARRSDSLGGPRIESLEALPEEIKTMMSNRDLLRSGHSRDVRQMLQGLLLAGTDAAQQVTDGASGSVTVGDLERALKPALESRETRLNAALASACAHVQAYNNSQRASPGGCPELAAMGSRAKHLQQSADEDKVADAVRLYDDWEERFVNNARARESDEAMAGLQRQFANDASMSAVLGLRSNAPGAQSDDSGLSGALMSAAAAIRREREQQLQDAPAYFPCTALLHTGRRLLEAWQAKKKHKKSMTNFKMLSEIMEEGDQEQIAGALQLRDLPEEMTMQDLRRRVRESFDELARLTSRFMGEIQTHFPEVILFIGQGLPSDVGALWRPAQTLDAFEEKEELPTESAHRVWRVRNGDEWYAIKEYSAGQPQHLKTCLKEATVIYRYRHPAIVEIKGLFQGSGTEQRNFYLQMPWYDNGSLDRWACADRRRAWSQVRSVLLDALHGLAHLHDNAVIHGDVKPSNILVDSRERGRLADFDISIDTKDRTLVTLPHTTMPATARGMTMDYAAPELKDDGKATRHTDMYAYGKTVASVGARCEPVGPDQQEAQGQTEALVTSLTAAAPRDRPSAAEATQRPFFAVLREANQQTWQTCLLCEANGEDCVKDSKAGVECSQGHFHCAACLAQLTEHMLRVENTGERQTREGRLMCFKYPTEWNSVGFGDQDLAKHLPSLLFQPYLSARVEMVQAKLKLQLEDEMEGKLQAELQRLAALDERERKVLMARKHIVDEILTLSCPRCKQAFIDFDGCFALKCGACSSGFCGWCLADCGSDAHQHVRQCAHKPPNADALFGSMEEFQSTHRKRQAAAIREYLARQGDASLQAAIKEACKNEL